MLRDERSWKSKKVSSSATAFGLLTAAPAVITVVCCDLIPVIIIDDYRGQRWEMVCGTSGGRWWAGALSTCSLGFLLIIYGDLRRPHTWTVWRRRCTYRGARRTNEAFRCRLCTSHMHHQNETSWPRELANTTNPHSLHVRAGKKKVFEIQQNTNVAADNDFSRRYHPPPSSAPFSAAQTLLSRPLFAFILQLTDNNAINPPVFHRHRPAKQKSSTERQKVYCEIHPTVYHVLKEPQGQPVHCVS